MNIAYSYLYGEIERTEINLRDEFAVDFAQFYNYYFEFLESDFNSTHIIEGLLLQLRRYGFLHLCSEEIFSEGLNVGQPKISRRNFDEFHSIGLTESHYWWRGYSPLIEKYLPDGAHDPERMGFDWISHRNLKMVLHVKKS